MKPPYRLIIDLTVKGNVATVDYREWTHVPDVRTRKASKLVTTIMMNILAPPPAIVRIGNRGEDCWAHVIHSGTKKKIIGGLIAELESQFKTENQNRNNIVKITKRAFNKLKPTERKAIKKKIERIVEEYQEAKKK